MNPIPWARILGVLALVVAAFGLVVFGVQRIKTDGAASNVAAQERQHAKDVEVAAGETRRIEADQLAAAREADRFRARALVDARGARVADDGLQQRFAAINAGCVSDHPAAASGSAPASSPADLRAYVLRGVAQAARDIASAADGFHGAGQQAQDSYPVKQ
jgi:hypothetical protein